MPVMLPPPGESSLMLDLDGTLLDIAATPDAVRVAPGLAEALLALRAALGGALAVVTGRPIEEVDGLFPGVPYAVAGEHGGAIRPAPDLEVRRAALPNVPVEWVIEASRIAEAHPGAMLEQKQRGFVLHYRAEPALGPALRKAVMQVIAPRHHEFQLMPALMAWEVRPRGADKGTAVQALAAEPPFHGRRPIFIGDDVTDEDGMAAARALGGVGLRVDDCFGTPAGVRAWVMASAAALGAGGQWPEVRGQGCA